MWDYYIKEGILTDGVRKIPCYSGAPGQYKNNPDFIAVKSLGSIPLGTWIIGHAVDTVTHGPCVLWLTPEAGTNTFDRSGFGIHGDSITHPGAASEGCIVTNGPEARADREYIDASPIRKLTVHACQPNGPLFT